MKHILKKLALLAVLVMGIAFPMAAQSTYVHLVITMNNGTEETYDMLNSSYMYFEAGEKLVITESVDGQTLVSYPLSDIRKITCHEMEGTEEIVDLDMVLYPNPARDKVTFQNVTGTQTLKIYALDGRLMKTLFVTDNQSVDISFLPTGLYLFNVGSQTFKMMKP